MSLVTYSQCIDSIVSMPDNAPSPAVPYLVQESRSSWYLIFLSQQKCQSYWWMMNTTKLCNPVITHCSCHMVSTSCCQARKNEWVGVTNRVPPLHNFFPIKIYFWANFNIFCCERNPLYGTVWRSLVHITGNTPYPYLYDTQTHMHTNTHTVLVDKKAMEDVTNT